jgi:Tfp pilus assembly protein PilF
LFIYLAVESKTPKDRNDHIKKSMAITQCERAQDYFDNGKFYAAHDLFMKAVQMDPNCLEAYHGLVLVYSNMCGEKDNHCVNALKLIEKMRKKFSNKDLSDLRVIEQLCRQNLGINPL